MAENRHSANSSFATGLRDAVVAGIVAVLLAVPLLGFNLVDSAQGLSLDYRFLWVLYSGIGVFLARLVLNLTGSSIVGCAQKSFSKITLLKRFSGDWERIIGWALISLALLLPFLGDRNLADRATLVLIYVMLGTGLSIVVGLAGLLDLGYVAFYAVGAYSYAILALTFGLSFWICLPLAGLFAASFGILLGFPVLRLRGDYLAIVTLGFGEIVRILLINWQSLTGGPNGIIGIPRPTLFGLEFRVGDDAGSFSGFFGIPFSPAHRIFFLYYLALALVLFTVFFVQRIRSLPIGRAWEALREDEIACRSLGINPTTIKLSAFALGASFAGFAGSFFATRQGFSSPESFTFIESAIILAIVVLGGMGSVIGIVFAAILLVGLPEWFRELEQFRMFAFGIVMVLVVIWRPHGLLSKRALSVRLNPQAGK
nr:MAG: high-affinity branched-chain amino acid ABC transporter permease LivM [Hyphomicrobiales bacterium]